MKMETTPPLPHEARESKSQVHPRLARWMRHNSFHSRDFADLELLLERKRERQVTISLGLPTLDEEQNIARMIRTLKPALMDEVPLLDEVVVIDSNSSDRTREIALDLDVPVHIHQEILPQCGSYRGKGEALWKSLQVLSGDIIIWIDADIENIHPRFVYGILGPLLCHDRIRFAKGFYRRPLRMYGQHMQAGGGRVTELMARPLFNMFLPQLAGMLQPLAGEYAGWRRDLERLPFFTGYGVETGLLIDYERLLGIDALAQVDLEERVHDNKSLQDLSRMSFAILQVVLQRLIERDKLRLETIPEHTMHQFWREGEQVHIHGRPVIEKERTPIVNLAAYRQVHGGQALASPARSGRERRGLRQ